MSIRGFPTGELRKARTPYTCDGCRHSISAGAEYIYIRGSRCALPVTDRYHSGCEPLNYMGTECTECTKARSLVQSPGGE